MIWRCPKALEHKQDVRFARTGVDPWAHVMSLNIERRHLTVGQKAMFSERMLEAEQAKAKERQREALSRGNQTKHSNGSSIVPTLAQSTDGPYKARDKVAKSIGIGKMAIDKAKKIREYAPPSRNKCETARWT